MRLPYYGTSHTWSVGRCQANIDILEASKSANKEEIRRLRAENKDVRMKLSQLVKGVSHGDEVGTREQRYNRDSTPLLSTS